MFGHKDASGNKIALDYVIWHRYKPIPKTVATQFTEAYMHH